ncbi:hypothetical protein C8R44DRAFT_871780 [Mycena epipterygia]|nr:hypothetical protein C8R44DRAFT_871780 [Mycena epipterygia]
MTIKDGLAVRVLPEGRAVSSGCISAAIADVRERHTGLELHQLATTPLSMQRKLRQTREALWAGKKQDADTLPVESLPSVRDVWPEVAPTLDKRVQAILSQPPPPPPPRLPPPVPRPPEEAAHWLLEPTLRGKYLDIIVQGAEEVWGGRYDKLVGVIKELPVVKRGKRGSVLVRFAGTTMAIERHIKIVCLFPLTTNEFPGEIGRARAHSVLEIDGVYVVIIGADAAGSRSYVGRIGFTSGDSVCIDNVLHSFPATSLCRSDPIAREYIRSHY